MISAFEEAKVRIRASGRVGVVNFSSNPIDYYTNQIPITARDSISGLIAPNPSTGYPGAFFVQSAGNHKTDACYRSFNDHLPSDGAMVIGAMDNNGQPVQPLNDDNGFNQGGTIFSFPEPGSNFGACVDAWAPGKKIKSTWNDGSNPTGDGTSFAAPHIAGAAAYLIETNPSLQTPAAVENAVRAHMVYNGASDLSNLAVGAVNLDGTGHVARPTVEFKIGYAPSDPAPAPIDVYSDASFLLRYDSVGAQSCDLYGYVNGNLWYYVLNFQPSYNWGFVQLNPDHYRWEVSCRSVNGTINTASASVTVAAIPPAPSAGFSVNGMAVANGATMSFTYPQSFSLAYDSTNTTLCNLYAYRAATGGFLGYWYSIDNFYPSFNWGMVTLDPGNYRWYIDCMNANFPDRPHATSMLNITVL